MEGCVPKVLKRATWTLDRDTSEKHQNTPLICISGKKKAHKHKLFCPVGLGTSPGLSLGQIRWKSGTNPGFRLILHNGSPANPGLSQGRRVAQKVYVKKSFMCLFGPLVSQYLCKMMPSCWLEVWYTTPICVTTCLPIASRSQAVSARDRAWKRHQGDEIRDLLW